MHLIPVIDVLNGIVVHAQTGQRDNYLPIHSKLTSSHSIDDILTALLGFDCFNTIYIADLDAILQQGDNLELIFDLVTKHSEIDFLLDAGRHFFHQEQTHNLLDNIKLIYGSENALGKQHYTHLFSQQQFNFLSLDFKENTLQGDDFLIDNKELWPENIFLMSLDYVGKNQGPDLSRYLSYENLFKDKNVYLAGGIRNIDDLITLRQHNIHGILLASCLHQQTLTKKQIHELLLS